MKEIYLAVAIFTNEGYSTIKAFVDKDLAQLFVDKCNEYLKTEPPLPKGDKPGKWKKYNKQLIDWEEIGPANNRCIGDEYGIITTQLDESNKDRSIMDEQLSTNIDMLFIDRG